MGIPDGNLYNESALSAGKIAEHCEVFVTTHPATADIKFGAAVMIDEINQKGVKTVAGASARFSGVAGFSTDATNLDSNSYVVNDPVAVIRTGVMSVLVSEAVTAGNPVRVLHTDDNAAIVGTFVTTAVPGKTALLSGAEFRSDGSDRAVVYLPSGRVLTPDLAPANP